MGRSPLPEAQRLATDYRGDRTNAAYTAKRLATVHAFPVFRELPDPTIPLNEVGRKTYDLWCRRLFDSGHLTVISQGFVETLSLCDQIIASNHDKGTQPSQSLLKERNRALGELKYLNADQSLVPVDQKNSRFSRNGFPSRLR